MATVKEDILTYLASVKTKVSTAKICEGIYASLSQTQAKLKELFEEGKLDREKENGSFVYKLSEAFQFEPEDLEAWNSDEDEEDEDEAQDECEVASAPTTESVPAGPRVVVIVRKDDQPVSQWKNHDQYRYAEVLNPFANHTRIFRTIGGAVVSIFITDADIEEIADKLHAKLPNISFGIADTYAEVVALFTQHNIDLNENALRDFFTFHKSYFGREIVGFNTSVPAPAQTQSLAPETPKVDTSAARRTLRSLMVEVTNGRVEDISDEEFHRVMAGLATLWIENN